MLAYNRAANPSSLSESERYLVFDQATFSPYFVLAPVSDPCSVDNYSILSSVSPTKAAWSAQAGGRTGRAQLIGSLGTYKLLIDKTIHTEAVSVFLQAQTRGLV